jgi:phospholipid/cholesterol/gamma-HCH transport system substrate-binding protein
MNSDSKRNMAVGAFMLFAITVLLTMTFLIRGGLWSNDIEYFSDFSNVSGLEVGSPVLVSGVRAGRVTRIQARKATPPIRVFMELDPSHDLRFDAVAKIVQQGFIGDKRIEINPGSSENAALPAGGSIQGVDPFDMEKVFVEANAVMADVRVSVSALRELVTDENNKNALVQSLQNLNDSMETVTRILQENESSIKVTMANAAELSERLKGVEENASKALATADTQMQSVGTEAEATMRELRETLAELRPKVVALTDSLTAREKSLGDDIETLMAQLNKNMEDLAAPLAETSSKLKSIMAKIDRGDGTIGLLVNDPTPFRHLSQSVEALRNGLLGSRPRLYDAKIDYVNPPAVTDTAPSATAP